LAAPDAGFSRTRLTHDQRCERNRWKIRSAHPNDPVGALFFRRRNLQPRRASHEGANFRWTDGRARLFVHSALCAGTGCWGHDARRSLSARRSLDAGCSFDAGRSLSARRSLDAGCSFDAGRSLSAGRSFDAGCSFDAGRSLSAGCSFDAGRSLDAGCSFDAGRAVSAGCSFRAGRSLSTGRAVGAGCGLL